MTPLVLLSAFCGLILDLNPTGPQFDALSYVAPPAMQGKHLTGTHPFYTVKTTDRIWMLKGDSGYPWDNVNYDSTGLYGWTTENEWGDPTTYTRWMQMHQVMMAPRTIRGGYPGMRWYDCDSRYSPTTDCGALAPVHDLGGAIIHEAWGPYTRTPAWGNLGTFDEITLVYAYGCSGATTDTCTSLETVWLTAEYGQVRWALYAMKAGQWLEQNASEFFWVLDGTTTPFFPCDN